MGDDAPLRTVDELKATLDDVHANWHGRPQAFPGLAEVHVYPELCLLVKGAGRRKADRYRRAVRKAAVR